LSQTDHKIQNYLLYVFPQHQTSARKPRTSRAAPAKIGGEILNRLVLCRAMFKPPRAFCCRQSRNTSPGCSQIVGSLLHSSPPSRIACHRAPICPPCSWFPPTTPSHPRRASSSRFNCPHAQKHMRVSNTTDCASLCDFKHDVQTKARPN